LAPVNEYADVARDQQVWDNEYILEDTHPTLGRMRVLGSPVYLSRTPAKRQCWAPELGQHTEEVLTETCGYSWDEIAALKDEEVIM
ncbi:CoA transferase, partial [Chloroflexota bacterium]